MIKSIDKINLIGLTIIFFAVILSAYTREHPEISRSGQSFMMNLMRPMLSLSSGVDQFVADKVDRYLLLFNTKQDNLELEERLKHVVDENMMLQQLAQENSHLRQLLDFQKKTESVGSIASVIAYRSGQHHHIVIDRGAADKVKAGSAVIDGVGLVGIVLTVSSKSAVVQLLNDRFTGIDALVRGKSVRGMVTGAGSNALSFDFVARDQEIYVGDRLVTSGLGGVYPPGLLIGVVSNITSSKKDMLFQSIEVHPAINLEALDTVMVLESLVEQDLVQGSLSGNISKKLS